MGGTSISFQVVTSKVYCIYVLAWPTWNLYNPTFNGNMHRSKWIKGPIKAASADISCESPFRFFSCHFIFLFGSTLCFLISLRFKLHFLPSTLSFTHFFIIIFVADPSQQ